MRTTTLVKRFEFIEKERSRITLGFGMRLHPTLQVLTLDDDDTGVFPTDDDLRATSWTTEPLGLVRWVGFECVGEFPAGPDGDHPTRALFRLYDGTTYRFWNGTTWAPITTDIDGEWSTEEQVCAGISSWKEVVASRKLAVVVSLKSDDARVAPRVREVKLAWECDAELEEDIILRSLVRDMKEKIRASSDVIVTLEADTDEIDLAAIPLDAPYEKRTVDAVFDEDADAAHITDLLESFDTGTMIATLAETKAEGTNLWVRFTYEPVVAVTTSRDYDEVEKLPAVIIQDPSFATGTERAVPDSVVNKATGDAIVVPAPIQGDVEFTLEFITDKKKDHLRLGSAIRRYFGANPLLRSRMLDEQFRLWLLDEGRQTVPPSGDAKDIIRGEMRARVCGVFEFHRPARAEKAILDFEVRDLGNERTGLFEVLTRYLYWGTEDPTGPINEAFVLALAERALSHTAARVLDVEAEGGEKIFFVAPVAFGTPTFEVSGFEGGFFRRVASLDVSGELCDVWESDALSLGATRVVVT